MLKDFLTQHHHYVVLYVISVSISIYLLPHFFMILHKELVNNLTMKFIAVSLLISFIPVVNVLTIIICFNMFIVKLFVIMLGTKYPEIESNLLYNPLGEFK